MPCESNLHLFRCSFSRVGDSRYFSTAIAHDTFSTIIGGIVGTQFTPVIPLAFEPQTVGPLYPGFYGAQGHTAAGKDYFGIAGVDYVALLRPVCSPGMVAKSALYSAGRGYIVAYPLVQDPQIIIIIIPYGLQALVSKSDG